MALQRLLRGGGITRHHTLFEKMPLHRITREREGGLEVFAGVLVLAALQLKRADCGEVEGIPNEAFWIGDSANCFQPALRAFTLPNGDSPVERYDGRRTDSH